MACPSFSQRTGVMLTHIAKHERDLRRCDQPLNVLMQATPSKGYLLINFGSMVCTQLGPVALLAMAGPKNANMMGTFFYLTVLMMKTTAELCKAQCLYIVVDSGSGTWLEVCTQRARY